MQRQGRFSQGEYAGKKKQTRRDKFLAEMEQVVPWARLVERLRPLYPKGERGRLARSSRMMPARAEEGARGRTAPSRRWHRDLAERCRNRPGCHPIKRDRPHE